MRRVSSRQSRKRARELTWEEVLRDVPEPPALPTWTSPQMFVAFPEDAQAAFLDSFNLLHHRGSVLRGLQACLAAHTPPQPPTLGSRIEEYLLAPSRVKETEVVDVACYLFGEAFASPSEVKRSVQQHFRPAAVDSQHSAAEDHVYHLVLADTFAWTHNLSEEEPPGYLPLGLLVVFFGKMLSTALHNTYKCHPQRSVARNDNPGQNPSTDVAIILRVKSGREKASYISKVLYEYKPSVNHLLDFVESKHLMELFLQCYYVLKFENQSKLLGCLTDLHCWHYFGLTRNNSKLKVTFYSRLDMTLPPEQTELASHLSFLMTVLQ